MKFNKIIYLLFAIIFCHSFVYCQQNSYFEIDTQYFDNNYYSEFDTLENSSKNRSVFLDSNGVVYWHNLNSSHSLSLLGFYKSEKSPEIEMGYVPYFKVVKSDSGFYYKTTSDSIIGNFSFYHPLRLPDFFVNRRFEDDFEYSGDTTIVIDSIKIPCYSFRSIALYFSNNADAYNVRFTTILFEKNSRLPILIYQTQASRGIFYGIDFDTNETKPTMYHSFTTDVIKPKKLHIWLLKEHINDNPNSKFDTRTIKLKINKLNNRVELMSPSEVKYQNYMPRFGE